MKTFLLIYCGWSRFHPFRLVAFETFFFFFVFGPDGTHASPLLCCAHNARAIRRNRIGCFAPVPVVCTYYIANKKRLKNK